MTVDYMNICLDDEMDVEVYPSGVQDTVMGRRMILFDSPPLTEGQNPTILDLVLCSENVDDYKRTNCTRYNSCLDMAASKGWPQFHCNSCDAFVEAALPEPNKDWEMLSRLAGLFKKVP
jgi:hypothetical protein